MKSPVVKRSIVVAGHKTSVSLEEDFWNGMKEISSARNKTLSELVGEIDSGQGYTERARGAQQRRAADRQPGDRVHQLIDRGEMKHADLVRERGLVDGDDVPVAAGPVQLAWAEFEVMDSQLAVRVTRLA